jgi:hypothetical protein
MAGASNIIIPEGAAVLPLSRGLVALVDRADLDWLSQWKWCATTHPRGPSYAVRRERSTKRTHYMHRELAAPPAGLLVDHINGDTLDNRRVNLRLATFSQNAANTTVVRAASGFRGVHHDRRNGRFQARCRFQGTNYHLGLFNSAEEAARTYDAFILRMHGPYARLNFPVAT